MDWYRETALTLTKHLSNYFQQRVLNSLAVEDYFDFQARMIMDNTVNKAKNEIIRKKNAFLIQQCKQIEEELLKYKQIAKRVSKNAPAIFSFPTINRTPTNVNYIKLSEQPITLCFSFETRHSGQKALSKLTTLQNRNGLGYDLQQITLSMEVEQIAIKSFSEKQNQFISAIALLDRHHRVFAKI